MVYFFTFLEGVASFLSPCVLPLLPVYISYFAGSEHKKTKAFTNSIGFVIGFSVVFILLAIIANRVGNTIIGYLRYAKIIFGILIIILGLNYIEIIKFDLFSKFKRFNANVKDLNFIKTFFFGVLFSISMTPCVGTFLGSALLLIASQENMVKGLILIVLYCIGLGLPFIISSILIDKLKNVFGIIKKNFKVVKVISGAVLIIMGIYLILKG